MIDEAPPLGPEASLEEVGVFKRWLREHASDLDPSDRETVRDAAVNALDEVEAVRRPVRHVDAVLNDTSTAEEASEPEPDEREIPEDVKQRASELLEAPDLLNRAVETMRARGLVAERTNARVLFLAGVGGTLDAPIHVVVHGPSAAGKNNLARRCFELLPPRYVLAVSGLSEHALEYRGGRIEGVLLLDEAEGQGRAEYGLRVAMSEGRITRLTVNKSESGRNEAEERVVEVAASVVMTTTDPALHPENQTRVFDLYVDEGQEVTEEVVARRAREAAGTADVASEEKLQVWRAAVELLEPADEVVIPWAEQLAEGFPTESVRARRDFPRVLALIEASALLHQRQRPRDEAGRLVATAADWRLVRPLVQAVLGPSMTGINETARELAELHDELVEAQHGEWLRRPELEKEAGDRGIASRNTVHKWAKRLVELGVWEGRREAGKAWEHRRIRDVVEEPIPLPKADELEAGAPNPPSRSQSGGGRDSSRSDRDSKRGPNSPQGKRPGKGESPSGEKAGSDWEGSEKTGETRENPSYQEDSEGLGGTSSSSTCSECGRRVGVTAEVCGKCKGQGVTP